MFKFFKKNKYYNQLDDEKADWLSSSREFILYFWDKFKVMLLKTLYSLYAAAEDKILQSFFLEIKFYTPKTAALDAYNSKERKKCTGEFKCYLPIVIKAQNRDEALNLSNSILEQLFEGKYVIDSYKLSLEPLSDFMIQKKLSIAKVALESNDELGTINLTTYTPKTLDMNLDKDYHTKVSKIPFKLNRITKRELPDKVIQPVYDVFFTKNNTTV